MAGHFPSGGSYCKRYFLHILVHDGNGFISLLLNKELWHHRIVIASAVTAGAEFSPELGKLYFDLRGVCQAIGVETIGRYTLHSTTRRVLV